MIVVKSVIADSPSPLQLLLFCSVIARICMDIRLLSHLYTYPERPPSLAKKLSDAQADLNGIRHMFTVSVARVAFAEEPEWVAQRFGRDSAKPLDNLMGMVHFLVGFDSLRL